MATILLSAAGAAIGGSIGGTVAGLSMAAVGRFAGGIIGRSIDQRLMGQGSDVVDTGRANRLRLTGSGEGDAIAQVYGRMRVAGQIIWATEFREHVNVSRTGGGGKGAPKAPEQTIRRFSYSVSVALALCEGEISHVGRIWADGTEIARDSLTLRVYNGSRDQLPDPRIEAVEGAGTVPAFRGTAYVVIEDLALAAFGNRVPQFTFEVTRPSQASQDLDGLDPVRSVRAVAMLPGSGEYTLATTPVTMNFGPGSSHLANVSTPSGKSDFATSLDNMKGELPQCGSTSLVVSWFGDDLRCGDCSLRPKVEQKRYDSSNMPWSVAGLTRSTAQQVPQVDGRATYGGTPTDDSVIEAIRALKAAGQDVMFYPFILMDQIPGNLLPDPYSDADGQPPLPWRGRITLSEAPGRVGTPDEGSGAEAEVAAFFGKAAARDFEKTAELSAAPPRPLVPGQDRPPFQWPQSGETTARGPVHYTGPNEWSYRRFILHNAALCAAAGGVESFCIGSEMRGLTQIRGAGGSFPAVSALIALAAEVRALLGPDAKIGYAADWSEYFGYQPQDGTGDRYFHLDPLWADDNIDFIGIDNYMPLSDWRDGVDHADSGWGSIYDLEYLKANIEGGEGYDWFYHSPEARAAQIRTPITDDAYEEPWVWRYKDIRNWWLNGHHNRIGGVRTALPSAWVPRSKPIRFTEIGCAAVDKGTNEPNKFVDVKSSESALPNFSDGRRDELIQRQYLRAMRDYWTDPVHNPISEEYGGPMIDMDRAHVWAWDARPFPFFPNNQTLWDDGRNHALGHWITGRTSSRSLASVVEEIAARAGVRHLDTSRLHGYVSGYIVDQVADARSALQPLMLRYGFDAVERDGVLTFRMRDGLADSRIGMDNLVRDNESGTSLEETRAGAAEIAGRVRLRFIEADGDFEVIAEEAVLPDDATHAVSTSEIPLAMTRAEGRAVTERWLSEARVSTDTVRLTLPPSQLALGAGDVIGLDEAGGKGLFRIDRVEQMGNAQRIDGVRIEPESYRPIHIPDVVPSVRPFVPPVPVLPLFLDLPLITGGEVPHAPHLAVTAQPWPGTAALHVSASDANYRLDSLIESRATVGILETSLAAGRSGLIDRGDGVTVRMLSGQLESIDDDNLLGGGNLCAIGNGVTDGWELVQFRDAVLVGPDTYLLSHRLRGQLGTETAGAAGWDAGSFIVMLDGIPNQINLPDTMRRRAQHYRIGPAGRSVDDPSFQHEIMAFEGVGLRPYSPAHLRGLRTPDGAVDLSWIRRTRIDGDRWDTPEVPLGEETESYVLRVIKDGSVLRELALTEPRWRYESTAQGADGAGVSFEIHVAQVSAKFGAGVFAKTVVGG